MPPSFGVILVVRFKIQNSGWGEGDGEMGVVGHHTLLSIVASSTATKWSTSVVHIGLFQFSFSAFSALLHFSLLMSTHCQSHLSPITVYIRQSSNLSYNYLKSDKPNSYMVYCLPLLLIANLFPVPSPSLTISLHQFLPLSQSVPHSLPSSLSPLFLPLPLPLFLFIYLLSLPIPPLLSLPHSLYLQSLPV